MECSVSLHTHFPYSLQFLPHNMAPPRAFDFTGDVAIVTGAGSRMDGKHTISNYGGSFSLTFQVRLAMDVPLRYY